MRSEGGGHLDDRKVSVSNFERKIPFRRYFSISPCNMLTHENECEGECDCTIDDEDFSAFSSSNKGELARDYGARCYVNFSAVVH